MTNGFTSAPAFINARAATTLPFWIASVNGATGATGFRPV